MMDDNGREFWEYLKANIEGTVLYVDDQTLSVIKWSCPGGISSLLEHGAWSIKLLNQHSESNGFCLDDPNKAIFLLSEPILSFKQHLQAIIERNSYQSCSVYLGLHSKEAAMGYEGLDDDLTDPFAWLEEKLTDWMSTNSKNSSSRKSTFKAKVRYAPLLWATILPNLLIAPSCFNVFPLLSPEQLAKESNLLKLKKLSTALASLLYQMNFYAELFVIGESARIVAQQTQLNQNHFYTPELETISVVIIERSMDLVAPLLHSENLLDQMYRLLPRLGPGSIDLKFPAGILETDADFSEFNDEPDDEQISACVLSHGSEPECLTILEKVVELTQKEALSLLRNTLVDVVTTEAPGIKIPRSVGRVSPALLSKILTAFRDQEIMLLKHITLVQFTLGVIKSLQEMPKANWDDFVSLEQQVMLFAATGATDQLLESLIDSVPKNAMTADSSTSKQLKKTPIFSLKDLMMLALLSYSLKGDSHQAEDLVDLENVLMNKWTNMAVASKCQEFRAFLQPEDEKNKSTPKDELYVIQRRWRLLLEDWFESCLENLRLASTARSQLQQFNELVQISSTSQYAPFIEQVLKVIFDSTAEGIDLTHVPSNAPSIGRIIKGLGRFLRSVPPHPTKYPVIWIVMLGGITFQEYQLVRQIAQQHPQHKILVLSTNIATSEFIFEQVFYAEQGV